MNLDQAAFFFTGSILIMLGFIVVTAGIVVINHLLHTYWKPVRIFKFLDYPPRFMTPEEAAVKKK
ncbi:hypothetical protein [Haliscomenobacter sp.]|uniref:hypothetical protein n=1 Tax=Haliscomenobacter sp. TaxID=2717303 RepID=UPI003365206A